MLGERESDFVVFQGMQNRLFGKAQKICLRYFKIGQTYFEICALYFFFAPNGGEKPVTPMFPKLFRIVRYKALVLFRERFDVYAKNRPVLNKHALPCLELRSPVSATAPVQVARGSGIFLGTRAQPGFFGP